MNTVAVNKDGDELGRMCVVLLSLEPACVLDYTRHQVCLFNYVKGNGNKKNHTQKRRRVCNLTEMKEDAGAAKGHIQACVCWTQVLKYTPIILTSYQSSCCPAS